jgi:hypothetical protein
MTLSSRSSEFGSAALGSPLLTEKREMLAWALPPYDAL